MKFCWIVFQLNRAHASIDRVKFLMCMSMTLTSYFRYGSHDVISHKKVLPSGESPGDILSSATKCRRGMATDCRQCGLAIMAKGAFFLISIHQVGALVLSSVFGNSEKYFVQVLLFLPPLLCCLHLPSTNSSSSLQYTVFL